MKLLLYAFFATLPLYYTSDFRVYLYGVSITINLIIIFILGIIILISTHKIKISKLKRVFIVLLLLFTLYHTFLYNDVVDSSLYFKYIIKIYLGFFIFFITYIMSAKYLTKNNIDYYLKIFIFSSSVLLSMYIFIYYYVLHTPFLGILIDNPELTTAGKNQAQLYMALSFPVVLYLFSKYKNIFTIYAFIVHIIAVLYIGSRGLWVSLIFSGLIYFLVTLKKYKIYIRSIFKYIASLVLFLAVLFQFSNIHLQTEHFSEAIDAYNKLISLYENDGDVSTDSSATEREEFIRIGINNLSKNIFFGNGLGYFLTVNPYKKVTHNDYIFFLSDMGLIGFFLYLSILFLSLYLLKELKFLVVPFYLDLLFINAYNVAFFWILLGIYLGMKKRI